ncbi:MAG: SMP-30/gluconolactonase/LRE family protein [Opitutus sp.]|nr:SMP-30/gluconolactonase/LRE family protein [Opitutus sp.]
MHGASNRYFAMPMGLRGTRACFSAWLIYGPRHFMTPEIPIEQFEIFATDLDHPECVAFDRHGTIWAGGEAGQIYRIDGGGQVATVANLGGFCAGLAFSPADELFVCAPALGIVRVAPGGKHTIFATQADGRKLICPNYGVFDAAGNYYVTDSGRWLKRNGRLLRFTRDGKGEVLAESLGYANGLALTPDGRSLFMVESDTDSVFRFRIGSDGAVGPLESYATECGRFPDGLTLDADGNLYVCCYASDEIWRVSPGGGQTLLAWDRWAIKLGSPTNMAFGGKDFDELYVANLARTTITRAKIGRRGQPLANQRAAPLSAD